MQQSPIPDSSKTSRTVATPTPKTKDASNEGNSFDQRGDGCLRSTQAPVFRVCNNWSAVATSQLIGPTLNPTCQNLCKCDQERLIQIQVLDQGPEGELVPMGTLDTTVRELLKRDTCGNQKIAFQYDLVQNGPTMGKISAVLAMIEIDSGSEKLNGEGESSLLGAVDKGRSLGKKKHLKTTITKKICSHQLQ